MLLACELMKSTLAVSCDEPVGCFPGFDWLPRGFPSGVRDGCYPQFALSVVSVSVDAFFFGNIGHVECDGLTASDRQSRWTWACVLLWLCGLRQRVLLYAETMLLMLVGVVVQHHRLRKMLLLLVRLLRLLLERNHLLHHGCGRQRRRR